MSAWTDLLARFDLSGRWQRLMPSLGLDSNASLEEAQERLRISRQEHRATADGLLAAQAALRDCQGRLQAGNAAPGAVPGPSVIRPPLPSFDGHHLNHYWACLWERREPIPVWLMPDCPVEPLEIAAACDMWDRVAEQVSGRAVTRFFAMPERTTIRPDYGLILYGPGPAARENFADRPSVSYPPVATRRYAARDPLPTQPEPMREQLRYCLEIRAADYTRNAMAHELGHVLGLSDHYFSIESDGKEGLWPVSSIMGNVDLGVTAHDIEDLTALYGAALLRSL